MEHEQKLYAAKTVLWPGATPFCPPVCGPNPLWGFGGSRPATVRFLPRLWQTRTCQNFLATSARTRCSSCHETSKERTCDAAT